MLYISLFFPLKISNNLLILISAALLFLPYQPAVKWHKSIPLTYVSHEILTCQKIMNQKHDPIGDAQRTPAHPSAPQRPLANKGSHGFVQLSLGNLHGQRFHHISWVTCPSKDLFPLLFSLNCSKDKSHSSHIFIMHWIMFKGHIFSEYLTKST